MTSPRRPRSWVDLSVNENLAAGGREVLNILTASPVDLTTITVVRILGRLLVIPSVVANSSVSAQRVTVGIGVAAVEAFDIGVTALPRAADDGDKPPRGWIYKEHGILVNQQDSGTVEAWHFPEFKFDVRGMRKVDHGILYITMENLDLLGGTTAVKVVGLLRALCLL